MNLKLTDGNCYGISGANGAGKSTFLKILSGEIQDATGEVSISPGQRMSILKQDHFDYNSFTVLDTIIQGLSLIHILDYGKVISTLGSLMQDFKKMVWGEEENKNLPEPPQQDDQ